jgi:hypothetical protein
MYHVCLRPLGAAAWFFVVQIIVSGSPTLPDTEIMEMRAAPYRLASQPCGEGGGVCLARMGPNSIPTPQDGNSDKPLDTPDPLLLIW